MSRIRTPATIDAAPEKARPLVNAVKDPLAVLPNMFRLISNSPQTLEGHLGLAGAPTRAVRFAAKLVRERGHVSEADVSAVRFAGYTDAQILEIIGHVALNTLTNYINEALKTAIDFPVAQPRKAA